MKQKRRLVRSHSGLFAPPTHHSSHRSAGRLRGKPCESSSARGAARNKKSLGGRRTSGPRSSPSEPQEPIALRAPSEALEPARVFSTPRAVRRSRKAGRSWPFSQTNGSDGPLSRPNPSFSSPAAGVSARSRRCGLGAVPLQSVRRPRPLRPRSVAFSPPDDHPPNTPRSPSCHPHPLSSRGGSSAGGTLRRRSTVVPTVLSGIFGTGMWFSGLDSQIHDDIEPSRI